VDPFQTLIQIAERSQQIVRELPSKKDTQTHWMGLGLWLLDHQFVVPMEEIAELMKIPQTTHLPGVKNWITGVANLRGRLMTIIDLALFFGSPSKRSRVQRRVFVIEGADIYYGFVVDESLGMQHFSRDSYSSDIGDLDERYRPFVNGSYLAAGMHWPVISLVAIADEVRAGSIAM
jgi:twitching motility protein PilI